MLSASLCRALLQKQLPPELLLALLSSQQEEVLSLSLLVLQDLARIVPTVIPVDAAPRLLQLLCCSTHGEWFPCLLVLGMARMCWW